MPHVIFLSSGPTLERSLVKLITAPALTSAPSLTSDGFGIDWLQEVKGKQHEERHQKDGTHQCQQHVAADEQSVNYLQEKDESDEVIVSSNWNYFHFHSSPPGVSRELSQRFRFSVIEKNASSKKSCVFAKKKTCFLTCLNTVTTTY